MNDMQLEFEAGDDKKYEINGIWNSTVYAKGLRGQLLRLYYLVLWKDNPEKENTWEPALAIQHLRRLVIAYHKDNPEKPTATSAPVTMAPLMASLSAPPRPIAKPNTDTLIEQKQGQSAGFTITIKRAKKS